MAGMPGPVTDEREGLIAYLEHQRYLLRLTAYGLTDEQARATPSASPLSVGGLIKHVARTERGWIDTMIQRSPAADDGIGEDAVDDYVEGFVMGPDETLQDIIAFYDEVAAETAAALAGIDDLGQPVPVPQGVPWYPDDVEAWSVRWVLLHVIEETARHTGHADIVRETVDGATAFPLMAAAEQWPASPWMTPWMPDRPVALA
jgi:uncharacterized damage-inducible protein DinB